MTDLADPVLHHPAVTRVREALIAAGVADTIAALPDAVHTAQAAAEALGCDVAAIAKSIVFRAGDDRVVLVITSGRHRVDAAKVEALIGQPVGKADAAFVRERAGFVIGGVAPVGHLTPPIVVMDETLFTHAVVRPAAGHPNSMFSIAPGELARISGAKVADVAA